MALLVGFGAMLVFRFLVVFRIGFGCFLDICLGVGVWAVCLLARRVAGTCCGSALRALCRSQQAPTTRLWVVEDSFGFGVLVFSIGCRCFFHHHAARLALFTFFFAICSFAVGPFTAYVARFLWVAWLLF